VLGSVARTSLTGYRIEQRTSFKHPIVGMLLGVALIAVPVQSCAGDPLGVSWLTPGSFRVGAASLFMLFCGLFLLWGVIRRRDEPWIVFIASAGERAFRLRADLSPQAAGVLHSVVGDTAAA
jgi:hypothetical protein